MKTLGFIAGVPLVILWLIGAMQIFGGVLAGAALVAGMMMTLDRARPGVAAQAVGLAHPRAVQHVLVHRHGRVRDLADPEDHRDRVLAPGARPDLHARLGLGRPGLESLAVPAPSGGRGLLGSLLS